MVSSAKLYLLVEAVRVVLRQWKKSNRRLAFVKKEMSWNSKTICSYYCINKAWTISRRNVGFTLHHFPALCLRHGLNTIWRQTTSFLLCRNGKVPLPQWQKNKAFRINQQNSRGMKKILFTYSFFYSETKTVMQEERIKIRKICLQFC